MSNKLKSYVRLFRLYQAPSHGLLPVIGALAVGGTDLLLLASMFIVGILLHAFFSLGNEMLDVEHDRSMESLQTHPLVSSDISMRLCYFAALLLPLSALAIIIAFFYSFLTTLLVLLCVVLFSYYLLAKRRLPGAEFPMALALAVMVLIGSSAAGITNPLKAIFVAGVVASQAVVILTVYRSLWLAQFRPGEDRPTIGTILGANRKGGRFYPSKPYVSFASATQVVFIASAMLPLAISDIAFENPIERMQAVFLVLALLTSALITYRVIMSPVYNSGDVSKMATAHYVLGGFIFALILADVSLMVLLIPFIFIAEVLVTGRLVGKFAFPPTFGTRPPVENISQEE